MPEQIVTKLRTIEVELAKSQSVAPVCRKVGITEQMYYRWRKEYIDRVVPLGLGHPYRGDDGTQDKATILSLGLARPTGPDVSRCRLTSACLSRIAKIPSPEWLAISGNGIDDISPL